MFFRMNNNTNRMPRIKNTISFKRLNTVYSVGLLFFAVLNAVFMRILSKGTYIMCYTESFGINIMLLSLFLADKEARSFFKVKYLSWKEENMFYIQKITVFKTRNKIGPIPDTGIDLEINEHPSKPEVIAHDEVCAFDELDGEDVENCSEINNPAILVG